MQRTVYIIRIAILALCFGLGFVALGTHIYQLQIVRHEELLPKAREKYTAARTQAGARGEICDVAGNLLAANLAGYDVLAEPRRFRSGEKSKTAELLAEILPVEYNTLYQRFNMPNRVEVIVARDTPIEMARKVGELNLPGIRLTPSSLRYYPKGRLFANIIGFLDSQGQGAEGIEQVLDPILQPVSGHYFYERGRRGEKLAVEEINLTEPRDGARVFLTIHEPIQSIVEDELMRMVEKHQPKAAYAVMADPRTGAIMAMMQYPGFNPNQREEITPEQWRNRIVSDGFEPGSILKGVTIAGALDYGTVSLENEFDCEQGLWFYRGYSMRDAGSRYDILSVQEIVQRSSNIGTAKIALEMGEQRMYQVLRRFGFGRPTGIELPHEGGGIIHAPRQWDRLTLTRIAIGHAIVTTPLQVVQAYCALANQGIIPQLHLIDRIEYPDGKVKITEPRPQSRALRPTAARTITHALTTVTMPEGTGRQAAVEGYKVAGKTGTAQKVIDGRYSNQRHIASFVGYVPAEDPAFVLIIVADEPTQNGYYGGTVAGPVFSRIAEKTLRHLQVAPTPPRPEVALEP